MLCVIDEFTREALAIRVERRLWRLLRHAGENLRAYSAG